MRWTPTGAHRLLQVRTRVLNAPLRADFERLHPRLRSACDQSRLAAWHPEWTALVPFMLAGRRDATDFDVHIDLGGVAGVVAPIIDQATRRLSRFNRRRFRSSVHSYGGAAV